MNNKVKKFSIIFFLLIVIGGICINSPIEVYADDPSFSTVKEGYDYINDDQNDYMGITKTAAEWVYNVFDSSSNLIGDAKDLLNTKEGTNDLTSAIWTAANTIYDNVEAIGICIMLLYFFLDILDKTSREQLSLELFLKSFIKLIVAFAFITSGIEFVQGLADFTSDMLEDLMSSISATNGTSSTLGVAEMEALAASGSKLTVVTTAIGMMIKVMIPYFGLFICKIVVAVVAYGRLIEIGLRVGFAPIGMADIVTSGSSGHGFRYLKKIVAVGIQGLFILGILHLYNALTVAIIPSGNGVVDSGVYTIKALAISFTTVALLVKSQSFANDLMEV